MKNNDYVNKSNSNSPFSPQYIANISDEDTHLHILPPQTKYFRIAYEKKVLSLGPLPG